MKRLADRLWRALGYRRAWIGQENASEWFAEGVHSLRLRYTLPWAFRLRLLIGGNLEVDTLVRMDVMPGRIDTLQDIAALPPNFDWDEGKP